MTALPQNLWLRILIGMILGIIAALIFNQANIDLPPSLTPWIAFPGNLFIDLLKMIIVPLVLSSVILGVASAGSLNALEKLGFRIIPYFLATTAIAITIGITMAVLVQPGSFIDTVQAAEISTTSTLSDLTIPDRIRNIIPVNITDAQLSKNMLQLVVLGIFIGIALLKIRTKASQTIHQFCEFTQDACMMIVGWAMWIAPLAVFSLLFTAVTEMGSTALQGMGYYMACVIGGLIVMVIVYLIIVSVFAGRNPIAFLADIRAAQIVAFSTSSSAATMPVSLSVAEEKLKTDEDVHGFVIPLGATINMDGTALYQACAAIFLCQVYGIDLTMVETITLLVTTIGASIGTPAMPGVGLIVLATILSSIGVPAEGIGIILGVDRLLDMLRTTVNVTGDLTATAVMQRWIHGKPRDSMGDERFEKV